MTHMTCRAVGLLAVAALLWGCASAGKASNLGARNAVRGGDSTVNVIVALPGSSVSLPPPEGPCLRKLKEQGLDFNGTNFLTIVAQGQAQMVALFVECQIPLDTRDQERHRTALMLAAQYGHLDTVNLLIDHGAGVNDGDLKGWTPLMYAAGAGGPNTNQLAIVAVLLKTGADANAQGTDGNTPLLAAAHSGAEDVIGVLLKGGADVKGLAGIDALLEASGRGQLGAARALLAAGADARGRLAGKASAFETATQNKDRSMQCLLVRYGAIPSEQKLGGLDPAAWKASQCVSGVRITSEPAGALVRRDATAHYVVGKTPIVEIDLDKDVHRFEFTLPGYEPVTLPANVQETGQAFHQELKKRPIVAPTLTGQGVEIGPPIPVAVRTPLYKRWWFWTLVGVAAAGAAAGATAGVLAGGPGDPLANISNRRMLTF